MIRFKIGLIFIFLSATIIFSCARTGMHPAKRLEEGGGEAFTVRGEVLWKGPSPVIYPIATTAYDGACGKRRALEPLELKRNRLWHKRLLDVAVWLEPVWEEMTPEEIENLRVMKTRYPGGTVKIVEKGCLFTPSTIVVPVGTVIEVVNEDRKDHWFAIEGEHRKPEQYVQYYGEAPSGFTFETPGVHRIPQGMPVQFVADKVDRWHLISGFHRWMDAWIIITDKIWFDEYVNKKGIFEISGVPRGVYRVRSWHPILGEGSSIVKVPEEIYSLVTVNYNEYPLKTEAIPSTVISTFGEVREEKDVWQGIDDW